MFDGAAARRGSAGVLRAGGRERAARVRRQGRNAPRFSKPLEATQAPAGKAGALKRAEPGARMALRKKARRQVSASVAPQGRATDAGSAAGLQTGKRRGPGGDRRPGARDGPDEALQRPALRATGARHGRWRRCRFADRKASRAGWRQAARGAGWPCGKSAEAGVCIGRATGARPRTLRRCRFADRKASQAGWRQAAGGAGWPAEKARRQVSASVAPQGASRTLAALPVGRPESVAGRVEAGGRGAGWPGRSAAETCSTRHRGAPRTLAALRFADRKASRAGWRQAARGAGWPGRSAAETCSTRHRGAGWPCEKARRQVSASVAPQGRATDAGSAAGLQTGKRRGPGGGRRPGARDGPDEHAI